MIRKKTWALVMNSAHARVLRGLEVDDDGAPEEIEFTSSAEDSTLRTHLSDRTGRSFASDGTGRRSAMEPGTDPVRHDMETFAKETLGALEKRHAAGEFERLAIIAAPKMMGIIRSQMPGALEAAVMMEHSANMVSQPDGTLRETVKSMLRAPAGRKPASASGES